MKRWTNLEDQTLRQLFGKVLAAEIGRRIDRTGKAVALRAMRLGLTFDRRAEFGPEFETFLREKHAAGWSDPDIAAEWGACRVAVTRRRHQLQLPSNSESQRHREKRRLVLKNQCREAGTRNLVAIREVSRYLRILESGWPAGTSLAEAKVLNALESGPATKQRICERLGMKWPGWSPLTSRGKSTMLTLVRRGHVRRWQLPTREYMYELVITRKRTAEAA